MVSVILKWWISKELKRITWRYDEKKFHNFIELPIALVSARLDAWKQSGDGDINPHIDTNPGYCELPPYPQHGFYVVAGDASTKPGQKRISILLEYACDEGYSLMGKGHVRCENGTWYDDAPQCMNVTEIIVNRQKPEMPLSAQNESSKCRLPPYPDQGRYEVSLQSQVGSSENYIYLQLTYRCHDGYAIDGSASVECFNGQWFQKPPSCVDEVSPFCMNDQPNGAEVIPLCKTPYFSSSKPLLPMKCVDGRWNYEPVCSAECGVKVSKRSYRQLLPSGGPSAAVGGWSALSQEFPWHAGIYIKVDQTYIQKCSGSIISPKLIVTAAHCFWKDSEGLLPSSQFAVAAGKIYQKWNDFRDQYRTQTSDVDRIVTPETFRGEQTKFQDDIALMYLTKPFVFNDFVRPVCVDFEFDFENTHLTHGNLGTIVGWGLIDEEGSTTPILQVVNLPYVKFEQCYNDAPLGFRVYITSDKICAGYTNAYPLHDAILYQAMETAKINQSGGVDIGISRFSILKIAIFKPSQLSGYLLALNNKEVSSSNKAWLDPFKQYIRKERGPVYAHNNKPLEFHTGYLHNPLSRKAHNIGTALCKGDSGGGLVFATKEGPFQRHYLRGVASAAPNNDKECNTHAITTFTRILKHERTGLTQRVVCRHADPAAVLRRPQRAALPRARAYAGILIHTRSCHSTVSLDRVNRPCQSTVLVDRVTRPRPSTTSLGRITRPRHSIASLDRVTRPCQSSVSVPNMALKLYKTDNDPASESLMIMLDTLCLQEIEYIDMDEEHLKVAFIKVSLRHTSPVAALGGDFPYS
ncbi:Coagulation factor IX [Eumeta japonica]|uniref:Coagulation factor IX n=1 Tax=Eumeta variegata TaxID=151549 RepID=A0A4C1TX62_EUMVA|nr:Coagulation factor IX [Eumeta japonica]